MTDMRDKIAELVYGPMLWARAAPKGPRNLPWMDGGNSIAQDEARRAANAIIAALPDYEAQQKRIEELTIERDEWQRMVGKVAETIPLKDTIGATGTLGDMLDFFKGREARIDKVTEDFTEVLDRLGFMGDVIGHELEGYGISQERGAEIRAELKGEDT